jgi:hypothetical protein
MVGVFSPLVRELDEMLYQFEKDFVVDSTALEKLLGWKATGLERALDETWADHLGVSGRQAP